MMLVAVLFSFIYLIKEADHHCHGEDCPVCECIQQCEAMLNQLCEGMISIIIIAAVMAVPFRSVILPVSDLICATPVSRKVRMDN